MSDNRLSELFGPLAAASAGIGGLAIAISAQDAIVAFICGALYLAAWAYQAQIIRDKHGVK